MCAVHQLGAERTSARNAAEKIFAFIRATPEGQGGTVPRQFVRQAGGLQRADSDLTGPQPEGMHNHRKISKKNYYSFDSCKL